LQAIQRSANYWLRLFAPFILCTIFAVPGVLVSLNVLHLQPVPAALLCGIAIVAAAFMLGWAGEAAELDLAGGLAVGLLAVVTILPEYVVSVYFSFAAGHDPSMVQYASANVTGANRLLLGFGWPVVALIGFFAMRSRAKKANQPKQKFGITLDDEARTDLGFLVIASVITLIIPVTGALHILVGILLVILFALYLWRQSHAERDEPELEGTAALVGALPKIGRRIFMIVIFLLAAAIILVNAEPFADNLVEAGHVLGVNQYLLVQWLAPLASEAPEFALAIIFAAKGKANMGLGILLSSKVNQWTALAGSLPIAYVVGGGSAAIPMDARQVEEFMLTTAQTVMGVALLLGLRLGARAASALFVLFAIAFVNPDEHFRTIVAFCYFAIAIFFTFVYRKNVKETLWAPFKLPKRLSL